ncbi:MAG: hypothetical protein PVG39_31675 [Desulfobacteraceae bacterium]|jgi:hypothetical protein
MAISVGVNSWATIAEAQDLLEFQAGAGNWFALDETPSSPGSPSQESFLRMAYTWLINCGGYTIPASSTNAKVKTAQILFALFLLNNQKDFERRQNLIASGVKEFSYSKWSETLGEITAPYYIDALLTDFQAANNIVPITRDENYYGEG